MRFFFRSRQFKIILAVFAGVVIIALVFGFSTARMSPVADVLGTVTSPIREMAGSVADSVKNFFTSVSDGNRLLVENEELKTEIAELETKLSDYENMKAQNNFYKDYLKLHEDNPDFKFADAKLISRDSDDPYKSFTINKGTLSGIHKHDPVITDAGLIGFVSDVGLSTAKVTTVLSPDIKLGALVSRTSDSGVVSGELSLAKENKTRIINLSRSCSISVGDFVETSGEGIFPSGIIIGKVESIGSDKYNTSIYAEIKPFVEIDDVKSVMVITDFEGKGGIKVKDGD